MNCASNPNLKLWFPRSQVKLSTICQMSCVKSNPASWVVLFGPPKFATPVMRTCEPLPENSLGPLD